MCIYGILAYYLLPISEYLSLTFLSRHGDNFVHIITILRHISLSWGAMCTLLDKINTWFFYIRHFIVIIYLSMLLMKIFLLFWYIPLHIVQIRRRLILHMMMWLIIWEMIFWRKWNEKMIRCVITLILDVGSNIKWVMTLNLYMILLKIILEKNYTYFYLKQTMSNKKCWG